MIGAIIWRVYGADLVVNDNKYGDIWKVPVYQGTAAVQRYITLK